MNAYEETSDVRRNVRVGLSLLITIAMVGQAWSAISPQPGPITRAVSRADDPFVSSWAVLLVAALVGVYAIVHYIVASAIPAEKRAKLPTLIGALAVTVLAAGTAVSMLAESTAVAFLLAFASFWLPQNEKATG